MFVEYNRSYQPAKFHRPGLSGSNFTRRGGGGGGGRHQSDLHAPKKPSPYRVKLGWFLHSPEGLAHILGLRAFYPIGVIFG